MAVNAQEVVLPDVDEPIVLSSGLISPVWYEALQLLAELSNATKDEVNVRHP